MKKTPLLLKIFLYVSIAVLIFTFIEALFLRSIPLSILLLMLRCSLIIIFVCIALMIIWPVKDALIKNIKSFKTILEFWKWINIIGIIFHVVIFIFSINSGKNLFIYKQSIFSSELTYMVQAVLLILEILTLYGITKKKSTGYYASVLFIVMSIVLFIMNFILNITSVYTMVMITVIALIEIWIGYNLYKNKSYFEVK